MGDEAPNATDRVGVPSGEGRLDSWKEIAAYLKRDSTTVRRWEKREDLPVHRHLHDRRESVYAFTHELDRWLENRGVRRDSHWPAWMRAALAAGVVATAAAAALVFKPPAAERTSPVRFTIPAPERAEFGSVSVAPDGRHLAFTAAVDAGQSRLWVRSLDSVVAVMLDGTDGAAFPFWSPDSRSVGFFAAGKLKTIERTGGAPHIVSDAPDGLGGTWSPEGVIVFAPSSRSALFRVPASGGAAVAVTHLEEPREFSHRWPEFLGDGRHFVYVADSIHPEHHGVYAGSLHEGIRKRLLDDASNAAHTRDGFLLFARERRLVAQLFDADRLEFAGDAVVVADDLREHVDATHKFDFSASQDGVLVYRRMPNQETRLVWRDRTGAALASIGTRALYADPTLSPDGSRLVVSVFDPLPSHRFGFGLGKWTSDLWLFDAATGSGSRFTFDRAADFEPAWSPDSSRIVFASNRGGSLDMYTKSVAGGTEELLLRSEGATRAQSWSPDGRYILYATVDPATRWDLWLLPTSGDRRPRPLLRSDFNENQGSVSPDGRWVAYTSDESGRYEVYVQRFPSLEGKWQISIDGGGDARWRSDGRELFYIAGNGTLMSVQVKAGATLERGARQALFKTGNQPGWAVARNHYDVSRDGRRFLIMTPVDDGRSSALTVVLNWQAALRN